MYTRQNHPTTGKSVDSNISDIIGSPGSSGSHSTSGVSDRIGTSGQSVTSGISDRIGTSGQSGRSGYPFMLFDVKSVLIRPAALLLLFIIIVPQHALATDINWTGGGDGTSWNQAANWNPAVVPDTSDDVFITMSGTYTVLLTASVTINSLTLGGDSGTQTLRKSNNLTLNNESIVRTNGVLELLSGYIQGDGSLTNNGIIRVDANSWAGINSSTLINEGQIFQDRGLFYIAAGAVLENRNLYRISGDINISPSGAMGTFINDGTLEKIDGSTFSTINVIIDSRPESIIRVSDGSLRLSASSMYHNMTFNAAGEDDELTLQSGTHTFRGSISGEPVGRVIINTPTEVHEEGATVDFGGRGLYWASSYFQGGGTLTNTGIIRVDANSWAGINSSTLINEGQIFQDRGLFYIAAGAVLENRNLYRISGDINISQSGAMGTFINDGILEKTSGSSSTFSTINVIIDSRPESIIRVSDGSLRLSANSLYHNMTFHAAGEDDELTLQSGTHTFRGSISGEPVGRVIINTPTEVHEEGATVDFGGRGLYWASSYFQGGGTLTNAGIIRVDANSWAGVNSSTLINEGQFFQDRGLFYLAAGAVLENRDLYRITGDINISQSGVMGTFINHGILEKTSGSSSTFSTINVNIDSRPESIIRVSDGSLRLSANSMYHNMTFHAAGEDDELTLQSGTHTFRGSISGEPVGRVIINAITEAHSEGATVGFGGTGLHWISSYFQGGGTLTNTGIIRVDANSWAGVNNSTLINRGELYLDRGLFYLANSARLENHDLVELNGSSGILPSGSIGTFLNNASLIKTEDYLANVSTLFQSNAGSSVEVSEGTLRFTANTILTSVLLSVPNEGAVLRFHSGIHTFSGDFNSAPMGSLELNSGYRAGGNGARFNFTEKGLQWTGGWQRNGGVVTNSGLITINSNGTTGARESKFINEGSILVESGGLNLSQEGVFENRGLFEVKADANITSTNTLASPAGSFINDGLFIKSGGENQSVFSANFINRVDSEFRLIEGSIRFTLRLNHNAGALFTGRGSIDVATAEFNNQGILEPGIDSEPLTFIGIYQAADSSAVLRVHLDSEISGPENGFLNVTETSYTVGFSRVGGNAILGGRLHLEVAGDFTPNDGDEFVIVNTLKGITGGFNTTQGLVNEQLGMSFYPVILNNQLILRAADGIPVLSGQFSLTPAELTAGGLRKVTLAGSGIGPDIRAELVCLDCEDPVNQAVIPGQISNLSNVQADLWFDLTIGRISGEYALHVTDPRGGEVNIPVFINEGPLFLSAGVLKQGNGDNRDPGLFVIRANRVLTAPLTVPYTFGGTAQKFVHFMTDQLGDAFTMPQGQDSLVISVFPVNAGGSFNRNLTLQVEYQQPPASDGFIPPSLIASMNVTGGTHSQNFRVFHSSPSNGGNGGFVTIKVSGLGFNQDTEVILIGGQSGDHEPVNRIVNDTGTLIEAVFIMNGQEIGSRDILVRHSSGAEQLLPGVFRVEAAIYPTVQVMLVAPPRVPRIRTRTYSVILKNTGNVDVSGFAVLSGLPENTEWQLKDFDVELSSGQSVNWSQVVPVRKADNFIIIETPTITLAAGESRRLDFQAAIMDPQNIRIVGAWVYQ